MQWIKIEKGNKDKKIKEDLPKIEIKTSIIIKETSTEPLGKVITSVLAKEICKMKISKEI